MGGGGERIAELWYLVGETLTHETITDYTFQLANAVIWYFCC